MIWSRQQFRRVFARRHLVDYIFLFALGFYGIYLIRNMFESGYFYNYDLNQHLVESFYVATVLLPQYHQLIGWNPYYYLGWPQGQFNPPAAYLIYAILYYVLSFGFSPLVIFKIMLAGLFLMQGFAIYFAAKGFGLGRLSALVAGFIALGTAGGFETGGPLSALYYGTYEYALAISLLPLTVAVFHQSFLRKSRQLLVLTATLVVFVFLLHTLAGMFLLIALGVYAGGRILRFSVFGKEKRKTNLTRPIIKFLVTGLIVAGICSFWILPAFANRSFYSSQDSLVTELGNYATTYNDLHIGYIFGEESSALVTNILHPTLPTVTTMIWYPGQKILSSSYPTFYQLLLVLAILGAAVSLIRTKSRFPAAITLALIGLFLYVSLGPKFYEFLWNNPMVHLVILRPGRAAAVARVFLALLVGASVGESFSLANKLIQRVNRRTTMKTLKIGAMVVIVLLGITLLVNSYALMSQMPLGSTTNQLATGGQIDQVFSWIKQNVPNGTRVAFQEYPQTYDMAQHLFAIAPLETGDQEIGSNYGFWWPGADSTNSLYGILNDGYMYTGSDLYNTLAGLNAGYVVVWTPAAHDGLAQSSNFFLAQQIGQFYIYELSSFNPSYVAIQNGSGSAKVLSFQPEKIVVELQNVTSGSTLLVRTSYFSNWAASSSQGQSLDVKLDKMHLPLVWVNYTGIALSGNGSYDVTLSYSTTRADAIGDTISTLSLVTFFLGSMFVLLESRTRFPIAEYLVQVLRRTGGIVRLVWLESVSYARRSRARNVYPREGIDQGDRR